jgi:hypothetical protein
MFIPVYEKRGTPDPLPPHPGGDALREIEELRQMGSDEKRKGWLKALPDQDAWAGYLAARRYHDAVRRNRLIEKPEQIPDKLERVRVLVQLGYGTPYYEMEALVVDDILENFCRLSASDAPPLLTDT